MPADRNASHRGVALDADLIHGKHARLLGESLTDAAGDFAVMLEADAGVPDELEFDAYFDSVPHHRSKRPPATAVAQFSMATVQADWQGKDGDRVASWDYCLPVHVWSSIRERFDAWVICGQVKSSHPGKDVNGLKVRAFDRDWLEDDVLGPATTDAQGRFRIDYSAADFRKALIGAGEVGGPDVYFRVETGEGVALLNESPERGRTAGRADIGPCFCVELEIGSMPVAEADPVVGPM